jgi:SPP1 gp7 family putative phage head morphogenesis protein
LFDIGQYRGFNQAFAQLNTNIIDELIKYPFNGLNFSDRIWRQKGDLIYKLREAMTTSFIQGKNPKELAESFAKVFQTKEYEAYRLLHTETTFMAEQATLQVYKDDGIEQYEFVATLDLRTSEICQEHDGKVYDVDKAVAGVNMPPLHPFCRSTTVPYFGEKEGTRAARSENGKTYPVPADMTYEQWYKEYVVNKNKSGIINTGAKNSALDDKKWLEAPFSNDKKFKKHIKKHLKDYGDITEEEYLDIARKLLAEPLSDDVEGFISEADFVFKYRKSTNDFAIGRPDGKISTLYKPDLGLNYWEGEKEKYGRNKKM